MFSIKSVAYHLILRDVYFFRYIGEQRAIWPRSAVEEERENLIDHIEETRNSRTKRNYTTYINQYKEYASYSFSW